MISDIEKRQRALTLRARELNEAVLVYSADCILVCISWMLGVTHCAGTAHIRNLWWFQRGRTDWSIWRHVKIFERKSSDSICEKYVLWPAQPNFCRRHMADLCLPPWPLSLWRATVWKCCEYWIWYCSVQSYILKVCIESMYGYGQILAMRISVFGRIFKIS